MSQEWDFTPIQYSVDDLDFVKVRDHELDQLAKALGIPKEAVVSPAVACFQALVLEDAANQFAQAMLEKYALRPILLLPPCVDCGCRHETLEGTLFCSWMHDDEW